MHIIQTVLILPTIALALTLVARRFEIPPAVLLVLGGMPLAFLPGTFHVPLKP